MENQHLYDFGPFRIDSAAKCLFRGEIPIPLTPKAFDTLLVLVRRRGHTVEKEVLLREVWHDSFVEESIVAQNVFAIRKVLGSDYIQTVPRRGYRFVADVREIQPDSTEIVLEHHTQSRIVIEEEEHLGDQLEQGAKRLPFPGTKIFRKMDRRIVLVMFVSLSFVSGLLLWKGRWLSIAPSHTTIRSVAVLPFKPLGEATGDELLGVGIADAIITRLSHLKELSVIPTSSVFKYAGQDSDAAVAGRELGVDAILTGTLQRSGERIRISVQMVGLADGKTLWSDRFDERFTDIFALQDSISEEIAHSLRVKIGSEDRFATSHPANTEAYQSYLMGLYFWNKRSKEGLTKAAEYFQDATDKDPNYAIAFAALADTYCLMDYYHYGSQLSKAPNERAKKFAQRSLDLDESLAEGHMAMALVQSSYENDCAAAEQSYRRALYLNPSYATAHQRYAWLLIVSGRLDEALREMKKAQQLDPLSLAINIALGQVLTYSHQYDESIRYYRRALELDPNNDIAHSGLGRTYELKGMYPEAIAEFEKAKQIDDHQGEITACLGHAFAQAGQTILAERMLYSLKLKVKRENASHYGLALIRSALGQRTLAFKELTMAITHVDFNTRLEIRYDPRLDPLRHDSNFNQLLKDHNLAG